MRLKKVLDNLHFWIGGQSGEIYVGVRDKNGGIGERVIVTEKVTEVACQQFLDKLQVAMNALEDIEEQCNSPHDVRIAEEALKKIKAPTE